MSQYSAGTVTVTNGSPTVTGSGSLWTGNVVAGSWITITNSGLSYQVQSVDSNTQITLTSNYNGATASAQTYVIFQDFSFNYSLPLLNPGDQQTATLHNRAMQIIDATMSQATSGVTTLAGCTDTTISAPVDGQQLVYDGVNAKWINGAVIITDINDLADVTITTVADGEVLVYDSATTDWINNTLAEANIAEASSLTTHIADAALHLTSGQNSLLDALTVTATELNYSSGVTSGIQTQINDHLSDTSVHALTSLSDVIMSGILDGHACIYDSTFGVWKNQYVDHDQALNIGTNTHAQIDSHIADSTIHFTSLDSLSDVILTAPSSNQGLIYNGTNWVNSSIPLTFLQLTDTPSSYSGSGSFIVRVNSGATALEFADLTTLTTYDPLIYCPGSRTSSPTVTGAYIGTNNLSIGPSTTITNAVSDYNVFVGTNNNATLSTDYNGTGNAYNVMIGVNNDINITNSGGHRGATYNIMMGYNNNISFTTSSIIDTEYNIMIGNGITMDTQGSSYNIILSPNATTNYNSCTRSNLIGSILINSNTTFNYSTVVGDSNDIDNAISYSEVVGSFNKLNGVLSYSNILGAYNTINYSYSTVLGNNLTINHTGATLVGNLTGSSRREWEFASILANNYSATGSEVRNSKLSLTAKTTDATPTVLAMKSTSGTYSIPLGYKSAITAKVRLIALRSDATNECAAYDLDIIAMRNNGGNVRLAYSNITTLYEDDATYSVAISADTVNQHIKIEVTGVAAKTIWWLGVADINELIETGTY